MIWLYYMTGVRVSEGLALIGMTWTSNVKVEGSSHLGNDKSKRFYSETLHKN